jgi:ATP-dependent Clp protease ATP-binding subunit ClpC
MFWIVNDARSESNALGHDWLGCEHLLLGLLHRDNPAGQELASDGVTLDNVRAELIRTVGRRGEPTTTVSPFTMAAERVMDSAERGAALDNSEHVEPTHLLHALLLEPDGTHITVLKRLRQGGG